MRTNESDVDDLLGAGSDEKRKPSDARALRGAQPGRIGEIPTRNVQQCSRH
jgi:hypothetical protein